MINREKRCSECLILQEEEMESPYVCDSCLEIHEVDSMMDADNNIESLGDTIIGKECESCHCSGVTLERVNDKGAKGIFWCMGCIELHEPELAKNIKNDKTELDQDIDDILNNIYG